MPKILEETTVQLERLDLHARSPISRPLNKKGRLAESVRLPGIHLSGILRYIVIESGIMKDYSSLEEEELPLRMALGLAWEEFAASLYAEIDWQPGETLYHGIAMNCDGLSPSGDGPQLEEFKFTSKKAKSADDLIREEWYWIQQGRGYCLGYDCSLVRWHICYVMGDYRGSGPIYKRYLISFSEQELALTSNLLLKNKDRAIAKGYAE